MSVAPVPQRQDAGGWERPFFDARAIDARILNSIDLGNINLVDGCLRWQMF
jgi:hypothetical protein